MTIFLLILQFCVAVALIGIVLIQRSEGGGLGVGSSQGMGAFMSSRGTANLLTRTTAILAGLFMLFSIILAVLYKGGTSGGVGTGQDILKQTSHTTTTLPITQQTTTKTLSTSPTLLPSTTHTLTQASHSTHSQSSDVPPHHSTHP